MTKQKLERVPIIWGIDDLPPHALQALYDPEELTLVDEIFGAIKSPLYRIHDYVELVKYNVKKKKRKGIVEKLLSMPYIYAVVTGYVDKGIHCYVKCHKIQEQDLTLAQDKVSEDTGIKFDKEYPDEVRFNESEDAFIRLVNPNQVISFVDDDETEG